MKKTHTFWLLAVLFTLVQCCAPARAQFHQKKKDGAVGVNQQAVSAASQMRQSGPVGGVQSGRQVGNLGQNPFSTMYMSDEQRSRLGSFHNAMLTEQEDGDIDLWYRAIHHSDDSFTETLSHTGDKMVEQRTKSRNGVLLLKRMITLDQRGQPTEVLIYDGRDRMKYRGVLFYDNKGRFREEQIFDTEEKLLRRKVQDYDAQGTRQPPRMWNYAEDIPRDLRLVITENAEEAVKREERNKNKIGNGNKFKLFGNRNKTEQADPGAQTARPRPNLNGVAAAKPTFSSPPPVPTGVPTTETQASKEEPARRGFKLGNLFRGNKK